MQSRRRYSGDVVDVRARADAVEVSEDIVRELEQTIRVARQSTSDELPVAQFAPVQMHPIDAWVNAGRHRLKHPQKAPPASRNWRGLATLVPWVLGAGIVVAGLLYVSQYGGKVKNRVVQQGNAAIGYLMSAKDSLEQLDVEGAKTDLNQAREQFDGASRELDMLGPSFINLISHIPGLSSLRIGRDLLDAGRLISDAGIALSGALDTLTTSGGILDAGSVEKTSLGDALAPFRDALARAQKDVDTASALIGGINPQELPDQYSGQFISLRDRLPAVEELVGRTVSMTGFLSSLTGTDRPRRYLVLFTNSSELRPTGGFPGSYGLLTFEKGRVKDFRADDIYNPDGQIKELVVPPLQLQHITPGWGMRDAAWWIDFPASARKVMSYWQRGGGAAVDGVITIKPDILAGILKITGPVSLPKYDTLLTADNVLATLQSEVEDTNSPHPKQIIVDLAPLIMQRLSSAPASQWAQLLTLFKDGLDARDIIMYFEDDAMEKYVVSEGFDGGVKQTNGDYLMVDISNIKGAKSDAVTDTTMKLESWLQDGTMVHRLTLTRRHNGGTSDFGFYNKSNHSWIRVLVPEGSVLRGISGNENPSYRPLMDYTNEKAVRDADLVALEATYKKDTRGAVTYAESGKTGFAFWMSVEPGTTEAVQIEYVVPARVVADNYQLLVQRQPGLDVTDFEFTLQKSVSVSVTSSKPKLTEWPDSWRLHDGFARDVQIEATLK
ncbi:MAG: DUF4012 domain-containing protein [Patescibacteria group bacterium]